LLGDIGVSLTPKSDQISDIKIYQISQWFDNGAKCRLIGCAEAAFFQMVGDATRPPAPRREGERVSQAAAFEGFTAN
jgi:hypothetical protein